MVYSKIQEGLAIEVLVTSTPQNIDQLIIAAGGVAVNRAIVNLVVLEFAGVVATPAIVARYTHDKDVNPAIASGRGKQILSFDEHELTPDQFPALFVAEGADVKAWVEQFDFEQQRT